MVRYSAYTQALCTLFILFIRKEVEVMNAFTTRLSVATVATALAVASPTAPVAGALGSSELSSAPRATHKVATASTPKLGEEGSIRAFCRRPGRAALHVDGIAADPSEAAGTSIQLSVAESTGNNEVFVEPRVIFEGRPAPDGRLQVTDLQVPQNMDLDVHIRTITRTGGDNNQAASSLTQDTMKLHTPNCGT